MEENIARCPFNPNHVMKRSGLLNHIDRCMEAKKSNRKLYKCKKDILCMYFEEDIEFHNSKCAVCLEAYNRILTELTQSISISEAIEKEDKKIDDISLQLSNIEESVNLIEIEDDPENFEEFAKGVEANNLSSSKSNNTILY
jgi:hypothetical protein